MRALGNKLNLERCKALAKTKFVGSTRSAFNLRKSAYIVRRFALTIRTPAFMILT